MDYQTELLATVLIAQWWVCIAKQIYFFVMCMPGKAWEYRGATLRIEGAAGGQEDRTSRVLSPKLDPPDEAVEKNFNAACDTWHRD